MPRLVRASATCGLGDAAVTELLRDRSRRVREAGVETVSHDTGDIPANRRDHVDRDGFSVFGHEFRWWTWMAVLVAGITVLTARRIDVVTDPKLWGEDGPIFMADAYLRGWPASLFRPYAGYLLLIPRMWAEVVSLAPVSLLALAYAVFALVAATASYAAVLTRRLRWLIPSDGVRLLLFFFLILLPGSQEIFGSTVMVVWTLGLGLIVLGLANEPRSHMGRSSEWIAVVLLGLTGFASLLALPVFWLRWFRQRTTNNVVVASIVTGCAFVQASILSNTEQRDSVGISFDHLGAAVQTVVVRVGGTLALGEKEVASQLSSPPLPDAIWIVSIGLLVLAALAFHALPPKGRLPLLLALTLAYGATFWGFAGDMRPLLSTIAPAGRYLFLSVAVLAILFAAAIPRLLASGKILPMAMGGVSVLLLSYGVFRDAAMPPYPSINWARSAECIAAHRVCYVPLNPPGWGVELPPIPGAR